MHIFMRIQVLYIPFCIYISCHVSLLKDKTTCEKIRRKIKEQKKKSVWPEKKIEKNMNKKKK